MTAPTIIFYDWPHSPFCMKIRAILDYKGAAYQSVNPLGAAIASIRKRGKIGKVPAIDIDGQLIVDSTDIAYELERRFPDPSIIPEDPRERAVCHAIEDWADDSLYFVGLHYRWHEAEGRKPIAAVFGKGVKGRLVYHVYLRRILGQLRGQGISRKPPEHVHRDMTRHFEAIEKLVTPGPFLLGENPYLCDFALSGQLRYLHRTPVGGRAMQDRTSLIDYLAKMNRVTGKTAAPA